MDHTTISNLGRRNSTPLQTGKTPVLTIARKMLRQCYHILRELGDEAWLPLELPALQQAA